MIKIVLIIARLNIGGSAINAVLLSEGLKKEGFETTLVTGMVEKSEGDMSYFALEKGINPVIVNELVRSISPIKDIKALWKIYRIIKKEQPDIVHTH
ncbi:MAG: glycosyltransferase family 1 protein, partial [Candidatus Omnitrophica bacterium CG02_land_8_20_14_3_00__42_8]